MSGIATDSGHPDAGTNVDPFGAVQPGDQLTHRLTEDRRQWCRLRLDEHHCDTEFA